MKKLVLIFVACLTVSLVQAQQQAMFTHYAFNTLAVNPAYAGSREALTVTALHRSQWVGFAGAPITQTLTMHAPFAKNRMGVGLSVLNDKIGPTNTTSLYADLAYSLPMNDANNSKLSFGLKSGFNIAQSTLSTLTTTKSGDDGASDQNTRLVPNFGVGAYYHNLKWYVGASMPRIINSKLGNGVTADATEVKHFFLIGGAVFNLNDKVKLKPTTFLKVAPAAPIELDLTGMFIFNDKLELGAMFRTGDAVGALIGYNVNNNFRIGYSFDISYVNPTFKYNAGSHELMLRYDFILIPQNRIASPRYF
jgi:type IX secretion system PorP/SprF family membrane protein